MDSEYVVSPNSAFDVFFQFVKLACHCTLSREIKTGCVGLHGLIDFVVLSYVENALEMR